VSARHWETGGHGALSRPHGYNAIVPQVRAGTVDITALSSPGRYAESEWGFWPPYRGSEAVLQITTASGFAGPRTRFRGFRHPECVPLPETMQRLDFTRMASVARARMKEKFGAKIYLHRKHGTFRAVTAGGSVESGSDNPEPNRH
jgi:hypothetical protein